MDKREEYRIRVGPLFKALLDKQKQKVNEATYGCVPACDWEAAEIIAKKVAANKLL